MVKAQAKKEVEDTAKEVASTSKEAEKIKVTAKCKSGANSTLKVKIGEKDEEILHGEVLELTNDELKLLKIASSSWTYEECNKKEENK